MHARLTFRDFGRLVTRCRPATGNSGDADRFQIAWIDVADGRLTMRTHDGTLTARADAELVDADRAVDGSVQVAFSDLAQAAKNKGVRNLVVLEEADGNLYFTLTSPDGELLDNATYELTDQRRPDGLDWAVDGEPITFDVDAAKVVLPTVGTGRDGIPGGLLVDHYGYYCEWDRCVFSLDARGAIGDGAFAVPKATARAAQRAKGPATMTVSDGRIQLDCKEATYVSPTEPFNSLNLDPMLDAETTPITGDWVTLQSTIRDWAKSRRTGIPSLVAIRPDGTVDLLDEEVPEHTTSDIAVDAPVVAYLPYLDKFLDGIKDDVTVSISREHRLLRLDQADGTQIRFCSLGFLNEDG